MKRKNKTRNNDYIFFEAWKNNRDEKEVFGHLDCVGVCILRVSPHLLPQGILVHVSISKVDRGRGTEDHNPWYLLHLKLP